MKFNLVIFLSLFFATFNSIAEGDPQAGEQKADTCFGCHATAGYRNAYPGYHVPLLGGQHQQYIEAALKAYKTGDRYHPTMQGQGQTLSDQDIADIAAYFSSLER